MRLSPDSFVCFKVWGKYLDLRDHTKDLEIEHEFVEDSFMINERLLDERNLAMFPDLGSNKIRSLEQVLEDFKIESQTEEIYSTIHNQHYAASKENVMIILDWAILDYKSKPVRVFVACEIITLLFPNSDDLHNYLVDYLRLKTKENSLALLFLFGNLDFFGGFKFFDYLGTMIAQGELDALVIYC
jgi:hypothetical protein